MKKNFKKFIKNILKKKNIETFNTKEWLPFLVNNQKIKLYRKGLSKTKQIDTDNFTKQLRFFSLIQLVEILHSQNKINDGNFVECGCWKGHSSYVISEILKKEDLKNFFIFDSFDGGLSEISNKDRNLIKTLSKKEKKIKNYSLAVMRKMSQNLKKFKFVKLFNGWIPSRFKEIKNKKIVFLHIDVDLYKPTLDSLKFFYKNLLPEELLFATIIILALSQEQREAWDEFFLKVKKNSAFL